jgi:hypothetical protein
MTDLPDPKAPLNKMEQLVYGVDAVRHPITGHVLTNSAASTDGQLLSPSEQARLNHLPMIEREHGVEVAREMERKLTEFERNGGVVELPAPSPPRSVLAMWNEIKKESSK